MNVTISEAWDSNKIFRPLFRDPETWLPWRTYAKALFASPLEDSKERQLYKKCTGLERFIQPKEPFTESYVVVSRRGGKSFTLSILAVFVSIFKDWTPFLTTGEKGWVFIISTDKTQSRIIKGYIESILDSQPIFRNMVEKVTSEEIHLKNKINIIIKTPTFRGTRGFSLVCCLLEELAFWRSEEHLANVDYEILRALRPAMATVPGSILIGISSPYQKRGILFDMYSKYWGDSNGPLIWVAPSILMNPTLDKNIIKNAYDRDPAAARSEWDAFFRDDISNFLGIDEIRGSIVTGRYELPKIADVKYRGFLDPSGGKSDSMCLCLSHMESSGKIVIDVIRERRPPFQPADVVKEFSGVLESFNVREIESDRYAGEWVSSAFSDFGIRVKNSALNKSEIYLEFQPLLLNGTVELLDSRRMAAQLSNLERRTRPGGKDAVDHIRGQHDDVANVVAAAAVLCSQKKKSGSYFGFSERPMY